MPILAVVKVWGWSPFWEKKMATVYGLARRFLESEDGPTATEYAVMLALIIVIALGAIGGIGTKLDTTYTNLDTQLPTGSSS